MYALTRRGWFRPRTRLEADFVLTPADFEAIARELGVVPLRARKVGRVAARRATATERIETRWNGTESIGVAEPGDWIVTTLDASDTILRDSQGMANSYVVAAARFPELYERLDGSTEFGEIFEPKGVVDVLQFSGGLRIMAPWGSIQRANSGYLIRNGQDVYVNATETFAATHVMGDA